MEFLSILKGLWSQNVSEKIKPRTIQLISNFRFELSKKLGAGTYGKVQLGINKETGQEVSMCCWH